MDIKRDVLIYRSRFKSMHFFTNIFQMWIILYKTNRLIFFFHLPAINKAAYCYRFTKGPEWVSIYFYEFINRSFSLIAHDINFFFHQIAFFAAHIRTSPYLLAMSWFPACPQASVLRAAPPGQRHQFFCDHFSSFCLMITMSPVIKPSKTEIRKTTDLSKNIFVVMSVFFNHTHLFQYI